MGEGGAQPQPDEGAMGGQGAGAPGPPPDLQDRNGMMVFLETLLPWNALLWVDPTLGMIGRIESGESLEGRLERHGLQQRIHMSSMIGRRCLACFADPGYWTQSRCGAMADFDRIVLLAQWLCNVGNNTYNILVSSQLLY